MIVDKKEKNEITVPKELIFVDHSIGIFSGGYTEQQERMVVPDLDRYNQYLELFSKQMELEECDKSHIYYLHNYSKDRGILRGASSMIGKDCESMDLFFLFERSIGNQNICPILIARLDDRLCQNGHSNKITVWAYDERNECFSEPFLRNSFVENKEIYFSYLRMIGGGFKLIDPFLSLGTSVTFWSKYY